MTSLRGLLLSLLVCGCGAECIPLDTSCDGDDARVCDYHETWVTYAHCGSLGAACGRVANHWGCMPTQPREPLYDPLEGVTATSTVVAVWAALEDYYGTTHHPRSDLPVYMEVVVPKTAASTVGRDIYIPFEVGRGTVYWSRWDEVEAAVHEHVHVVQWRKTMFPWEYVLSVDNRLHYEMQANLGSLVMEYWQRGKADTARLAAEARGYGARETDVRFLRRVYEVALDSVELGVMFNKPTEVAVQCLRNLN